MQRTALAAALLIALPATATAQSPDPGVDGAVLAVTGKVLDLTLTISDLDGSTSDVDRGDSVEVQLAADVFFAFGSADLTPAATGVLAALAQRLQAEATGTVAVVGHTDSVGDDASNLTLSQRRADTVVAALRPQTPGLVLTAKGAGETQPVAPNALPDGSDDPAGRQRNRRVAVGFDKKS